MGVIPNENLAWQIAKRTTFIFDEDSFEGMTINRGDTNWYFFKTGSGKLIKRFCLEKSPRVATFCTVKLVKKEDKFVPRLSFEKRNFLKDEEIIDEYPCEELTHQVKAKVDTEGGQENFWKLISALNGIAGVQVPGGSQYEVVNDSSAAIARAAKEMDRTTFLSLVKSTMDGGLTAKEIDLLLNRRQALEKFRLLLSSEEHFKECQDYHERETGKKLKGETLWQNFFQANPWIFGYGLSLVWHESFDPEKLESTVSGNDIFDHQGRRVDALMRTKTVFSSLLFCEIKTHKTKLLEKTPYRGNLQLASTELVGAVAQVQDTSQAAIKKLGSTFNEIIDKDGFETSEYFTTIRPRHAVVLGTTDQLLNGNGKMNRKQVQSFENFRRSILDVEILTFDELYDRASFIAQTSHL